MDIAKIDTSNPNSFTGPMSPISIPNILGGLKTGNLCCIPNIDTQLERLFPALNQTLISMLLVALATQKYRPDTKMHFRKEYDYIVVGAGSAGAAVAGRLSEKGCVSVLLLEAGSSPTVLSEIPGIARTLLMTDMNWNYLTVPQRNTGNGLYENRMPFPVGKAVGGSSIVNALLYIRGNRRDYDDWAASGADKWSWKHVFPYYLKLEDNVDPDIAHNGFHNVSGPVTFSRLPYIPELKKVLLEAIHTLGYPYVDPNGPSQLGYSDYQANIRYGQRCSSAKAYLAPNDHRPNLDIVANAFVTKVVISRKRARGVYVDFNGSSYFVRARREVILSAGTISTPQILMLSGIGPRETLEKFHIPVVVDLPVGKNLQDHNCAIMNFVVNAPIIPYTPKLLSPQYILEYIHNRSGPLTSTEGVFSMAFERSYDANTPPGSPNYQLYFLEGVPFIARLTFGIRPEVYAKVYKPYEKNPTMWCLASILKPRTRGYVSISSTDPYDPPVIDPKYLGHPEDMAAIVAGMKACLHMGTSEPMRKFGVKPFDTLIPGCEHLVDDLDKYLECQARSITFTLSHHVGTAKMGNPHDPTVVVDQELRVKGVKGLRVVDASVMPTVISGNTNIACMMIGERAADMIKETIRHC